MSWNARRERRSNHRLCSCGRRALYFRPSSNSVSYRRDHPLCPACWGRLRDRFTAGRSMPRRVVLSWPPPQALAAPIRRGGQVAYAAAAHGPSGQSSGPAGGP